MVKVEHIGIAVDNLEEVNDLYHRLFDQKNYKTETVASESVNTSFFKIGDTKIEFLASTNDEGTISKYIQKRGQGLHHIAFEVEDIHQEMVRLKKEGFHLINEQPKKGADNKLVCFIHPKSTNGVLVELCQEIKE